MPKKKRRARIRAQKAAPQPSTSLSTSPIVKDAAEFPDSSGAMATKQPAVAHRGRAKKPRFSSQLPDWYVALFVLFAALPALVAPYGHKFGYSPDLHMAAYLQVGMAAALSLMFFFYIWQKGLEIINSPLLNTLLLFYAWSTLTLIWGHNGYEAMVKWLDWSAAVWGAFITAHALSRREHLRWMIEALYWSGILIALLGLAQYLFDVKWVDQYVSPSATFNNKNMAAQYGLLTFPLGVALFFQARHRLMNWVYAIGSCVIVLFVLYTRTRAAMLSLLLQLILLSVFVVYLAYSQGRKYFTFAAPDKLFALLGASAFFVLFIHLRSNIDFSSDISSWFLCFACDMAEVAERTAGQVKFDGSGIHRISIWSNTFAMIWEHPWGVGIGNWVTEYPLYHTRVLIDHEMSESVQHINTHNDYLEIIAEVGWFGGVLLGILMWRIGRGTYQLITDETLPQREILLGVCIAIIGIGFDAIFSFPFQQPVPVFFFGIYVGILARYFLPEGQPPWFILRSRFIFAGAGTAMLAAMIALLVVHVDWFDSEVEFRKATIASQKNAPYEMLLAGKKAFDKNPWRYRLLNFVAMAHLRRDNIELAIENFEKILSAYPHLIHTLNNASQAYIRAGQFDKARDLLQHLVSIRKHDAKARKNLGIVLYGHLNRQEESMVYFREALALDPEIAQGDQLRAVIQTYEARQAAATQRAQAAVDAAAAEVLENSATETLSISASPSS